MRRFYIILCIYTLLITSGCMGETTYRNKDIISTPEPLYEINWYFFGPGELRDIGIVSEEASKYLKQKINATIKLHCFSWEDWKLKINTMLMAKEYIDIFTTAEWWNYSDYASNGMVLPLNELIDEYAPNTKKLLGDYFIKGSQINGINYGVPINKERAHSSGYVFNKKYIDKYGFDLNTIKSARDIEAWLEIIKKNEGIIPFGIKNTRSPIQFLPIDIVSGDNGVPGAVLYNSKDARVINHFELPEYMEYCRLIRRWYMAGYVENDAALANNKYEYNFKNGNYFCAEESLKPGKDAEISNEKITWVQKYMTPIYTNSQDCAGSMLSISSTSKDPVKCMMFIELLNNDKYLNNLVNFGIEGIHYTKISQNIIRLKPDNGYELKMMWAMGNQFLNYLMENENIKKWESYENFNNQAVPSPALGFRFDKTAISDQFIAVSKATYEYKAAIECGAVEPEIYIPKMIQEQKRAGSEKVLVEMQRQFDEWKAKVK